jgi:hypothetical protein
MDSLLLQTHSDFFKTAIAEQHDLAHALRLRCRRRFWRRARSFLFCRSKLYKFCLQSAVWVFPISAAHFFIISNVLHCSGRRAFHDARLVCDFKNPRRFFAANRERFVLLIDC